MDNPVQDPGDPAQRRGVTAPPAPAGTTGPALDAPASEDAPAARTRRRRGGARRRTGGKASDAPAQNGTDDAAAHAGPASEEAPSREPERTAAAPAAGGKRVEDSQVAAAAEGVEIGDAGGEAPQPGERKRRRGRRGGRRHKSHENDAAGAASEGEAAPQAAAQPDAVAGHEPEPASPEPVTTSPEPVTAEAADADGDGAKPPRRRRGRRGGSRRAKTSEAADDGTAETSGGEAEATPPVEITANQPGEGEAQKEPAGEGDDGAGRQRRGSRRSRSRKHPDAEVEGAGDVGASEVVVPAAAAGGPGEAATESQAGEAEAGQPKRRRGRRKKGEPAAAGDDGTESSARPAPAESSDGATSPSPRSAEAAADAKLDQHAEDRDPERGKAWTASRRRRRPVGAPAPEEKDRIILATESPDELRVAVVEDERLAEVYLQRDERPSILGNIYQAKVQNVLRGMDAAFVDFGLEKSGFLHVDEVDVGDGGPRRGRRITQLLQPGQEILVQITKDPMKGKGARLTTRCTLAGRYVVYVPGGEGVGVSRRLSQEERDRLRDACKSLHVRKAGLIVRTVAEGKGVEELRRDVQYLSRQWSRIKAKAEKKGAPALIHEEVDVTLEAARDLFNDGFRAYIVDSPKVHKKLVAYLERVAPELVPKIELYEDSTPLFEAYGVEDGIEATLARRVTLPSGGNLVIDHTEALTVIDVNSGRYTGGSGLEETITRTNLDAATEVVRQLRLRDIGGIIVIDFIDMSRRENRAAVLAKLEHELALDRTKSYVVEISPLGLVEMTRQSTTEGTRGLMTTVCPSCHSTGRVLSADTMSRDVERALRRQLSQTKGQAVLVEVQRAVADRLEKSERMRRLERETGRRVYFEGSSTLPIDTMNIVATGSVAEVEAQRLPVHEGEELDVEIRHGLPFSPEDGVAVVSGYQLVVKGGRRFVGSVKRVRVEVAQRHGGLALIPGNGRRRGSN